MSNGESKPVCPPKARNIDDDWLDARYWVLDETLKWLAANGHKEAADALFARDRLYLFERPADLLAKAIRYLNIHHPTGHTPSPRGHGWTEHDLEVQELVEMMRPANAPCSGDPQVQPTSADKDAVYVTVKGTRHHFWRDEAEQVVRELQAALASPGALTERLKAETDAVAEELGKRIDKARYETKDGQGFAAMVSDQAADEEQGDRWADARERELYSPNFVPSPDDHPRRESPKVIEPIRHTVAGIWAVTIPADTYNQLRKVLAAAESMAGVDESVNERVLVRLDELRLVLAEAKP